VVLTLASFRFSMEGKRPWVVNARLGHSWHPLANATLVGVLCADRRHQGCQM